MRFVLFLARLRRENGHDQEGQRPLASAPGNRDKQTQTQPANAQTGDDFVGGGAHCISEPAFVGDLFALPALEGFVYQDHQGRSLGHKSPQEQAQKDTAELQRRVARRIEDAMVLAEVDFLFQTQHTQGGGNGAFAGSENGAIDQRHCLGESRAGKGGRECGQKLYNFR